MPIKGSGVSFRFADGTLLFDEIHFSLHRRKVGLVGRNGSGKSTLLKLITGELEPARGSLLVTGTSGYFAQAAALTASPGEWTRKELERLFHSRPDRLLLDEPTNNLDRDARASLARWVQHFRGELLVASHDRELLETVEEIWELRNGELHVYGGNYPFYREAREREIEAARRELVSAQAETRRAHRVGQRALERQARRVANAKRRAPKMGMPRILLGMMERSGERTAARLRETHARKRETAAERLATAHRRAREGERARLDAEGGGLPRARVMVDLRDAQVVLRGPSKVALIGPNGCGKTTLLRSLLSAAESPERYPALRVGTSRIAYLDQELLGLDESLTLLESLQRLHPGCTEDELRVRLGRALFAQEAALKPVRQLSGGERLRATLVSVLGSNPPPELWLLDEPTNHLDLESLGVLEATLAAFPGAAIVVSHDRAFLEAIEWDEIWEMKGGIISRRRAL